MLIGIIGQLGSGKTLLSTILGYKIAENPLYDGVYANYHIKHPKVKVITPIDMIDINPQGNKRALIILDEVYAWLDSRVSSSVLNRFLSWIILQSRKRNMDIIFTSQLSSLPDLRLKELSDIVIIAENVEKGFKYQIIWQKGLRILSKKLFLPYEYALKYFDKFDTREIVEPILFERMKADIMHEIDAKALNQQIDGIVEQIIPKLKGMKRINKAIVEASLLEIGKPKRLTDVIYGKLKLRGL